MKPNRITNLNSEFLPQISKIYETEKIEDISDGFSFYRLTSNKGNCFLLLNKDSENCPSVDMLLDRISLIDKDFKKGQSYLCVTKLQNPNRDMCTHCNGKTFVHFIFIDPESNNAVFDTDFYYSGSKDIKKLIGIYSECFEDLRFK